MTHHVDIPLGGDNVIDLFEKGKANRVVFYALEAEEDDCGGYLARLGGKGHFDQIFIFRLFLLEFDPHYDEATSCCSLLMRHDLRSVVRFLQGIQECILFCRVKSSILYMHHCFCFTEHANSDVFD